MRGNGQRSARVAPAATIGSSNNTSSNSANANASVSPSAPVIDTKDKRTEERDIIKSRSPLMVMLLDPPGARFVTSISVCVYFLVIILYTSIHTNTRTHTLIFIYIHTHTNHNIVEVGSDYSEAEYAKLIGGDPGSGTDSDVPQMVCGREYETSSSSEEDDDDDDDDDDDSTGNEGGANDNASGRRIPRSEFGNHINQNSWKMNPVLVDGEDERLIRMGLAHAHYRLRTKKPGADSIVDLEKCGCF